MPSRSPADATRFTSTGPHASHQFTRSASASTTSPKPSSKLPGGDPGAVPGETPQQRIARLRQAATKAKMENITLMDKLYVHGRVWADRLHRATALGLIGATSKYYSHLVLLPLLPLSLSLLSFIREASKWPLLYRGIVLISDGCGVGL